MGQVSVFFGWRWCCEFSCLPFWLIDLEVPSTNSKLRSYVMVAAAGLCYVACLFGFHFAGVEDLLPSSCGSLGCLPDRHWADARGFQSFGGSSSCSGVEEYMENRVFTFIHHYSGSEDRLAEAIQKEAKRRGVRVKCISADISQGDDLLAPKPFEEHMKMAADGDVDGFHAGWPCTTFSRLRWRPSPGLPGPVRSKAFPNGFISNTASQQSECDRGTLFLARSLAMGQKVTESRGPGVGGAFYTFENPPPSGVEQHLSAWEMPEYLAFMERHHPRHVDFNTCCYEEDLEIGKRHFKPQRFAGNLHNLLSLKDVCRCGDAGHDPIVGSAKSKASAAYPRALASDYAESVTSRQWGNLNISRSSTPSWRSTS